MRPNELSPLAAFDLLEMMFKSGVIAGRRPRDAHLRDRLMRSFAMPFAASASGVGSEEAPIEGLASVRHSNGTCGFPAFRFHEWPHEVPREGSVRQGYLVHQRVGLLLLTFERQMIG